MYMSIDKESIVKDVYYGLQAPTEFLPTQTWGVQPEPAETALRARRGEEAA